jgi:GH25 family lysozyme M1 (1,4-beta-N-acetylmuramidase)
MKTGAPLIALAFVGLTSAAATPVEKRAQPKGIDVSSHQGNVDWTAQKSAGVTFAYVKATEGTGESSSQSLLAYRTQTRPCLPRRPL